MKILWSLLLVPMYFFGQFPGLEQINDLLETKEYEKAKILLEDLHRENPSKDVKELLADTYGNLREWDSAIPLYEELVQQSPNNANLQFKYGGVMARKAENASRVQALTLIGKIKKSFLKSASLDKRHIDVRWGLIEFYTSVPVILGGSKSKAYDFAQELLEISPIEGHFALAYLYGLDKETQKAKNHLEKTIPYFKKMSSMPRNQLNYMIAKVCGDFNMDLENGIKRRKIYLHNYGVRDGVPISQAYYQMAKLYRLQGNRQAASIWIKKALRDDGNFKLALEERKIINML